MHGGASHIPQQTEGFHGKQGNLAHLRPGLHGEGGIREVPGKTDIPGSLYEVCQGDGSGKTAFHKRAGAGSTGKGEAHGRIRKWNPVPAIPSGPGDRGAVHQRSPEERAGMGFRTHGSRKDEAADF